jgi:hypothetical protein
MSGIAPRTVDGTDQDGSAASTRVKRRWRPCSPSVSDALVTSLAVAASTVRAVLSERCPHFLAENGGPFKVSYSWVSFWLYVNLR